VYKYTVLYLLILIGILFEPDFLGIAGNVLLKVIILGGISYFLYDIWKNQDVTLSKSDTDIESSIKSENDSFTQDLSEEIFENNSVQLNRIFQENNSFREYLENQFKIIWDFILPHNGYLIHADMSGNIFVIHQDRKAEIKTAVSFSESPLFDLVDKNNGFLVENNLEKDTNLLQFYGNSDYKPASLMAFSSDVSRMDKLYWVFDADSSSFFNENDFETLKRINAGSIQMLNAGLQNFSLIDGLAEQKTRYEITEKLNEAVNVNSCLDIITDFLVGSFEASKLTIAILESGKDEAVIQKAVGIDDPYKVGYSFPLDEGLNGWVIMKNKPYLLENIDKGEYFVPRFSRTEKTNYSLRSFLSAPISNNDTAYGMITLEDKIENKYKEEDKERLISCCSILAAAIGRFQKV